jgi:hypothetical protein
VGTLAPVKLEPVEGRRALRFDLGQDENTLVFRVAPYALVSFQLSTPNGETAATTSVVVAEQSLDGTEYADLPTAVSLTGTGIKHIDKREHPYEWLRLRVDTAEASRVADVTVTGSPSVD